MDISTTTTITYTLTLDDKEAKALSKVINEHRDQVRRRLPNDYVEAYDIVDDIQRALGMAPLPAFD